jgi:hypothetical protein
MKCFICGTLYFSKIVNAINNAKINIEACLRIWLDLHLANKKRKQIKIRAIEASGNTLNLQTPCSFYFFLIFFFINFFRCYFIYFLFYFILFFIRKFFFLSLFLLFFLFYFFSISFKLYCCRRLVCNVI